ncbi:MAG: tetratricopeptide repeat protein [Pseudomonadota bacterium]|nr:tetratricopeptide repeat protein [Pseudomonadota bacterium]
MKLVFRYSLPLLLLMLAACETTGGRDPATNMIRYSSDSPAAAYVNLAKAYLEQGDMVAALDNATAAVKADRHHVEAQVVLALIYQRMNDIQLAEKHYAQARKLAPNDPLVANAYGTFLCTQRRYSEADSEFNKAAASVMNPSPWVASTNAGLCQESSGRYALAKASLRQALQQNPDYAPARSALKRLAKR